MKATLGRSVPVALYLSMILVPLLFAVDRLMFVTGMNPFQAILHLDEHPFGTDAITFSPDWNTTPFTVADGATGSI